MHDPYLSAGRGSGFNGPYVEERSPLCPEKALTIREVARMQPGTELVIAWYAVHDNSVDLVGTRPVQLVALSRDWREIRLRYTLNNGDAFLDTIRVEFCGLGHCDYHGYDLSEDDDRQRYSPNTYWTTRVLVRIEHAEQLVRHLPLRDR
jgi:hypothetical protein